MKIKGQVTIFIIIAIVIIAGVVGYFLLRDKISLSSLPATFQPVEQYFIGCINDKLEQGKQIMSDRGGWIYAPDFEPGSEFAPFSSELDFLGMGVPYWYYVSGNNLAKEQIPSKSEMQEQLARYLEENLECDFTSFIQQGYVIYLDVSSAEVNINDLDIQASVNAELNMVKEEESYIQKSHEAKIDTKFGKLYSQALEIYNSEKQSMFLEIYAIDFLRIYAPVDGVELSCAPKIWAANTIFDELKLSLEANFQALKTSGSENDYFKIKGLETSDSVNFMYTSDWPSRFEVWPAEGSVMAADPVGNQEGLGILGFCYVSYHFVYDMMFPVLIQVYDNNEMFQFPVAVVIQKNNAREAVEGSETVEEMSRICDNKNAEISVYTFDVSGEPLEADVSFKCFDTSCSIGRTELEDNQAVLKGMFPRCVNGILSARSEGYNEKKVVVSSNSQTYAEVYLDKFYDTKLNIQIGGKEIERGVIYFTSSEYSTAVSYPDEKSVKLVEGLYNITLYVYANSTLIFPASTQKKCIQVPSSGIFGFIGQTKEECIDIQVQEQKLTSVIIGGGKTQDYFTPDRLDSLEIAGQSLPTPRSLEDIQKNYESFENKILTVE